MSAVLAALVFILSAQAAAARLYQNGQCSYSFAYPNGWQVVKNPDYLSGDCAATLRPSDYDKRMAKDDVDVYTLTVQVSEGTFLQEAAENGFDFDGKWMILGRQGSAHEAQVTNANGWMILQGLAEVGCFHVNGGNAGLCDEHRVVAKHQSDDRIVVIIAGPQAELPIDAILKTFKFLTKPR